MIPAPAYRELRAAFDRGNVEAVLGQAQAVLDQIEPDPDQSVLVPAVLLLAGASLAGLQRYPDALAWLRRGASWPPRIPHWSARSAPASPSG